MKQLILTNHTNREVLESLNRLKTNPDYLLLQELMEEYELKRVEGVLLSEEDLEPTRRKTLVNMRKFISHCMNLPENYTEIFKGSEHKNNYDPYV